MQGVLRLHHWAVVSWVGGAHITGLRVNQRCLCAGMLLHCMLDAALQVNSETHATERVTLRKSTATEGVVLLNLQQVQGRRVKVLPQLTSAISVVLAASRR